LILEKCYRESSGKVTDKQVFDLKWFFVEIFYFSNYISDDWIGKAIRLVGT